MKLLDFDEDEDPKRNSPLSVRLPAKCLQMLKELGKVHGRSQSKIVERLIRLAYAEIKKPKK